MKKHIAFIVFVVVILAVGFLTYRDYGVSWDEQEQMEIGRVNYIYITNSNPTLLNFADRYYGPFFETPLWRLTVNLPNPEMIYTRHLVIFLVFVFGVILLYVLAYRLFCNPWWSLITAILLVLSPRIFADSFYNSKDIPFLSFFTLAFLSMVWLVDIAWMQKRWIVKFGAAAFSALTCAIAVDIRLPGIVLIPFTSFLLIGIVSCRPNRWKDVGILFVTYLILSIGFIILFWPILWHDPIHEFINAYVHMSHYPWYHTILYRGQFIKASNIPWHYIPTWILITTPLLQLGGFVLGILGLVIVTGKGIFVNFPNSFRFYLNKITPDGLAWFAVLGWLVGPLATVIILHSVIYDAWRQMFFLYPAILLIAVYGMKTVYSQLSNVFKHPIGLNILALVVLITGFLEPIVFTIRYYPFENVFFNVFAGNSTTLRQDFEQDYWGLSYKQGIDYILSHDPSNKIKIDISELPGKEYIHYMLTPEQASRLVLTPIEKSNYFITTFRWHPQNYGYGPEYFSIKVRGTEIMAVYKLK
ncbi:MAG: phospholipid carrier-dependent glycosyltransferase [Anaerolineales bacterium]